MISIPERLQSIQAIDLTSFVRQALNVPAAELLHWEYKRLQGGSSEYAAGGLGVYRFFGAARDGAHIRSWSMVLKIVSGAKDTSTSDPSAAEYWKREVLLYQSGILAHLPLGVAAPQCYGVTAYPNEEYWIWLEYVEEAVQHWTLDAYALAAYHCGLFNGAYLAGYPLPKEPWLSQGRVHEWLHASEPLVHQHQQYFASTSAQRWLSTETQRRMLWLWERRQAVLDRYDQLPHCFCHHDAFRRNLFLNIRPSGERATVAIDWGIAGIGRVGEEVGLSTANNLFWLAVPIEQAAELDDHTFTNYLAGLRAAGWDGDARLARLGYTVNAGMTVGVAFAFIVLHLLQTPQGMMSMQHIFGLPPDEVFAKWSLVQPFLLDLGEEAYQLTQELT